MSIKYAHIRHGFGAVRPYLYGHLDLLDFVKQVFKAEELERAQLSEKGLLVEVKVGDSVIVLDVGDPPATATRSSISVYVEDVDAAYQRALQAGAHSMGEPVDKPYQERSSGVKDMFGNIWWITMYVVPETSL